jgi:hypothetical protein
VDQAVVRAVAAAVAAHTAQIQMNIEQYASAHSLQAGLEAALGSVSAAVPHSPWHLLAASLPMDVCATPVATVPPHSVAATFATLPQQWSALNACIRR